MGRAPQHAFDPHTFLAKIGTGRTLVAYQAQHPIFAQGEVADAVFYIQDGPVTLTVVSAQGKEAVIAILEAQAFFGEGCLAGQPRRMATATALTDGVLMRIAKPAMLQVLHAEPAFAALFMAYLLSRNSWIEEDLIDHLFNSSEKRLARGLLLLAHCGKDGREELVMPKVSQETLAEMISTTRSRVSFFLKKFRKLGFIDYNGGMRVHSARSLSRARVSVALSISPTSPVAGERHETLERLSGPHHPLRAEILPSNIYRRTTAASTATMSTITPRINQIRLFFFFLPCCRSRNP